MNCKNPWTMHLEENSHAQASRKGGATLRSVNSARMKQTAFEIRPIFAHSGAGCGFGHQPIRGRLDL